MNVLIVDDEPLVREMLEHSIPWEQMGIAQVFLAEDGIQAKKIIDEKNIDILVSDIVMPNCNGLELVSQMRLQGNNVLVVFITGFCDKQFMKEAIRLGVVDFIEKPIDMNEVEQCIKSAILKIQGERQSANHDLGIISHKLVTSYIDCKKGLGSKSFWSLFSTYYGKLEFKNVCVCAFSISDQEKKEVTAGLKNELNLYPGLLFLSFDIAVHRVDFLLFTKTNEEMKQIQNTCKLFLLPRISFGYEWGSVTEDLSAIALKAENASKVIFYDSNVQHAYRFYYYPLDSNLVDDGVIIQAVNTMDFMKLGAILKEVFSRLQGHHYSNVEVVRNQLYGMYGLILSSICTNYGLEYSTFVVRDFENVCAMASLETLEGRFDAWLIGIQAYFDTKKYSAPVNLAIQYIAGSFGDKNLQISDVAHFAKVSTPYLCTIFKKEVKLTVNTYIQQIRIHRAQALLLDSNRTLSEITEEVGFRSVPYFSKLFKKQTGKLPSSCRNMDS